MQTAPIRARARRKRRIRDARARTGTAPAASETARLPRDMAEPQVAAPSEPTRDDARSPDEVALDLVVLATLAAIGAGLVVLTTGNLAWDRAKAIDGVIGQLGETLPAAVLVMLASGANLAAGGVLARLAVGAPFAGVARAVLAATVGAVLLDAIALFVLGGLGLFRGPILIAIHVAILGLGWRVRPILEPGSVRIGFPGLVWALIGVAWLGAIVLQLASPVVPFLDVLPNHVAPVERLRTFGEFAVLTESPSPIYGPSRTFLGYVGWLGTIATMTGLPAGLAVSAFILPGSLLVGAGVHRLATALGGPGAGTWGLIAFTLTESFGRMTDARATVLVLPLALGALAWIVERIATLEPPDDDGTGPPPVRDALLLGAALAAAVLVHPIVGALTVATTGLVVLLRPTFAPIGVPAVAVAACLAIPQAAAMLGLGWPSVVAVAAVLPAVAAARLLASVGIGRVAVALGRILLLGLVPLALVLAESLVRGAVAGLGAVAETMPLLAIGTVVGFVLAPRAAGHPVILAALVSGAVVAALTQAVPEGGGLLTDSIRFELPKTLQYWLPVFAALVTALGLHRLWRRDDVRLVLRAGLVGVFLVVMALPLRSKPIDDLFLGEHRLSETLAIDLRHAGRGYWVSYPDTRHVVDATRLDLLDVVREAIAGGRIDGRTNLLHVAPSFQQWVATPFGVFTGVRETVVSPDAKETIHTVGGRLRPLDRLDALLRDGSFAWAALEPGEGVPDDARERIVAAGFRPVFANEQGELFVRP
jgi:hypothetical protein